ncbi:pyruvate, phosphate dikinase [Nocardioides salsibiostraticola]
MTTTHQVAAAPDHESLRPPAPLVYDFADGGRHQKELLGGKGANLAEMTNLGLPVPPGFIVSTDACRAYLADGFEPARLLGELENHLYRLETATGRHLGGARDPLLVAVRSGAKFSMPGMMETVLDIGLNDESVEGLARQSGDARFAWDSYRRLLQMYGTTVLGVDASAFAREHDRLKAELGVGADRGLGVGDLQGLVTTYRGLIRDATGQDVPSDPREQLHAAVLAVFDSWNTERADLYRRREHIDQHLGTAVTVQAMVFGNHGDASGSGVCFTRDPSTGRQGVYGDYLPDAQGEDVVSGVRDTLDLAELAGINRPAYDQLLGVMDTLEQHYHDMCDIEFTIEDGHLWILQTRVGKRTAEAAFRSAVAMVDEGLIDLDEAVRRVTGAQLAHLMFPCFDATRPSVLLAIGTGASPGAAVGRIALDSATAERWAEAGDPVILVRAETNPDDLRGMLAAQGIVTARGGKTSHAAVVARGMGRTCVCGVESMEIDTNSREVFLREGPTLHEGDTVSVDGTTGEVFAGAVPVVDSAVVEHLGTSAGADDDDLVAAVSRILDHADSVRRLRVHANADNGPDAARARRLGAEGIGLCRTEHMFLGERRQLVEDLILAEGPEVQGTVLEQLLVLQRQDFVEILEEMDGLPVTIRLIDPPLHEFLPDLTELSVRVAEAGDSASDDRDRRLLVSVRRLHEQNPMLGLRGVRLGIVIPGLFAMQTQALLEAVADRIDAGGDPRPEIMVPLVASSRELAVVREQLLGIVDEVRSKRGIDIDCPLGTMIEVPRAALTADLVAESAEFFSFGTNDLTQMTWGFSRDDVEGAFFDIYRQRGIFDESPFETLDVPGVGSLVSTAVRLGRLTRPDLGLGVCGEHGGDPASIQFFDAVGLDYVSCSPYRVPIARLESARAALQARDR